jgi:hypothetical protein
MPGQPRAALLFALDGPTFGGRGDTEQAGRLSPKAIRIKPGLAPEP